MEKLYEACIYCRGTGFYTYQKKRPTTCGYVDVVIKAPCSMCGGIGKNLVRAGVV